jgi:hypothetical protein
VDDQESREERFFEDGRPWPSLVEEGWTTMARGGPDIDWEESEQSNLNTTMGQMGGGSPGHLGSTPRSARGGASQGGLNQGGVEGRGSAARTLEMGDEERIPVAEPMLPMTGVDEVPPGFRVTSCDPLVTEQWVHYKENAASSALERVSDMVMSQVRAHQEGIWMVGRTYAGEEAQWHWAAIQPPEGMVALRDVVPSDFWGDPDLVWEALRGLIRVKAVLQKTSSALRGLVLYLPRSSMHSSGKGGKGAGRGRGRGGGQNAGGVTSSGPNDGR